MKLVEQEEKYGCMVACLAMVMGTTYEAVKRDFYNDFEKEGIAVEKAIDYLADNGFTVVHKEMINYRHREAVRKEMLRPFAPAHIVRIQQFSDAPFGHVVAMTAKGKILCPQKTDEREIRGAYAVSHVLGVYR